eukprot:EG_transcript_3921
MSSMMSFSGSTRSSQSDWAAHDGSSTFMATADGEEANADSEGPLLRRGLPPTGPIPLLIPTLATSRSEPRSDTSRSSARGSLSRRFSTSSLKYNSKFLTLTLHPDAHEPNAPILLAEGDTGTPRSIRRTRSLELDDHWRQSSDWADSPLPPLGPTQKDEASSADETTMCSQSLPPRAPSNRKVPLRRIYSSDCLPSKAARANLLDFEAVKSFHNFHTKPATLRDRHLFWKALWRALLFPWCRTWWVTRGAGHAVGPWQFEALRLLYLAQLTCLLLYALDWLPGLPASEMPEKCFWDLWRPCIALGLFAIVHADVVAVAPSTPHTPHHRKARGPPLPRFSPTQDLGHKLGFPVDDELCSEGSDSNSDGDETLDRQLQLQESLAELSVNAHRWLPNGKREKETLTLKQFRSILLTKVGATARSSLNVTATRVCLVLVPLFPWALALLEAHPCPAADPAAPASAAAGWAVCWAEGLWNPDRAVALATSGVIGVVSTASMICLSLPLLHHLSQAELTFSRRLVYARFFKSITSSGKARRYGVPHFSLKNGANIRFWLALRGGRPWLAQHAEQRAADVVVTMCFAVSCLLLGALLLESSKGDDFPAGPVDWDIVVCSAILSFWMLRFLVIGSQINAKYSDTTVLLTEQINLQLRMLVADNAEKLDRLKVTSNVLKVATKLLHELGKPTKISGLAMNKQFYNLMRVVVLSALSAALSEPLGFKIRLTTLAKMK